MSDVISHLHIGQLLDVATVSVNIKAPGLKAHTLIVGQSGSGKSFMLGRLLEEIAAKTNARMLILDPNSDFVRFSKADRRAWSKHKRSFVSTDTWRHFLRKWSRIRFDVLTTRGRTELGLKGKNVKVEAPNLSWGPTGALQAAAELGFDTSVDVEEVLAAGTVVGPTGGQPKVEPFEKSVARAKAQYKIEKADKTDRAGVRAAASVWIQAGELQKLNVWVKGVGSGTVRTYVRDLFASKSPRRVLCVDLASLGDQKERLIVANAALTELWNAARPAWVNAIKEKPQRDNRCPVFVVIDEAHNQAPIGAAPGLAQTVRDILARIATEGRKYGLFLLMVTQRPIRLDETLRTQCDNLGLMKMNNRHDLKLVEDSFGFVPKGWVRRAMDFQQGDLLLAGGLVDRPVYVHTAPRRTAEGGRNLRDSAWLGDPYAKSGTRKGHK